MLVMMKHPVHGRLPVYSIFEVEANKAAGWVVDLDAPETKGVAPSPVAPEVTSEVAQAPKTARESFLAGMSEDEV